MPDIKQREEKIKAKRKATEWKDFVKEIGSRMTANIYKQDIGLTRYPKTSRHGALLSVDEYRKEGRNIMHEEGVNLAQPFFSQLTKLYLSHPKPTLNQLGKNENAAYSDSIFTVNGAYLSFAVGDDSENMLYSFASYVFVKNAINCVFVTDTCDNIFSCTDVTKSFNIFYSRYINNSSNIRFCSNMTWCHECLFCDGLLNAAYNIHNKPLSKEMYFEEKEKILAQKAEFAKRHESVNKNGESLGSKNMQWQRIIFSENVENGFLCSYLKDARNAFLVSWITLCSNFYDTMEAGFGSDDFYAVIQAGTHSNNVYCSNYINHSTNIYYSFNLDACSYCLGCIGLNNKSFCIFNKEYSKDERFVLADKIFAQMEKDGDLWKFFPASMNPFYFNDTLAYLIDDTFTKEEVLKDWYLRRDEEIKVDIADGADVITIKDFNQFQWFDTAGKWNINPEILKKVIQDNKWNYYKIVPMELDFLQKYWLPLPELHRLDRIKLWFKFK